MNERDLPALKQALVDEYPTATIHLRLSDYGHMLCVQVDRFIVHTPWSVSVMSDDWRVWLHRIKEHVNGQRPS